MTTKLRERIKEIKALAEKNTSLKRAARLCHCEVRYAGYLTCATVWHASKVDVYNPKKTKYWVEKKTSASMKAKQLVRETEVTSYEVEPATDGDAIVVGQQLSLDLGELELSGPSGSSSSAGMGGPAGGKWSYVMHAS